MCSSAHHAIQQISSDASTAGRWLLNSDATVAASKVQTRDKMAQVIVTMRIMPADPDVDLAKVEAAARKVVADFGGEVGKVDIKPFAFGLKAVEVYFVADEAKGSTEPVEQNIAAIPGVESVEVIDVRRAIG